jgi:uncharacterized protein YjbI with pentapeptide repeats
MPEPRSSESPKPPYWSEWKAQNGSKRWYCRLPLAVEWALEWFVYRLRSLALFDLLELAGKLTIVVAIIFWFLEADDRAKERHYRAWELINSARGSTGDGGRRDALQDLNRDGVSLAGAPLEQAWLPGVELKGATLWFAHLIGANLAFADLQSANLIGANLEGADLWNTNFEGANLRFAILKGADLWGAASSNEVAHRLAHVYGAPPIWHVNLMNADLEGANLQSAVLVNADLEGANLQSVNLWGTYLGYANVRGANFTAATFGGTDLQGARHLTQEQLDAANGDDQTQLPDGLTRPAHWAKAKGTEGPPPAQPDAAERAPAASVAPGSDK